MKSALKRVEETIGGVDRWPPFIILHMFSSVPDARVMKQIAAFMYGHSIDLETVTECYVDCRGREYTQVINEALIRRYCKWMTNKKQPHQAEYYNMHTGCWMWINGKDLDQEEEVGEIRSPVADMGLAVVKLEYPEWEWVLRCAIEHIRAKGPSIA